MSLLTRRRLLLTWLARHDLRYVQASVFAEKYGYSPRSTQRDFHYLCEAGLLTEATAWRPGLVSRERRSSDFCVTTDGWVHIPARSRPRSVNLGHIGRSALKHGWQVLTYSQDEPFAVDIVLSRNDKKWAVIFDEPMSRGRHYSTSYMAAACRDVLEPAGVDVVVSQPLSSFSASPDGLLSAWPPVDWPLDEAIPGEETPS